MQIIQKYDNNGIRSKYKPIPDYNVRPIIHMSQFQILKLEVGIT